MKISQHLLIILTLILFSSCLDPDPRTEIDYVYLTEIDPVYNTGILIQENNQVRYDFSRTKGNTILHQENTTINELDRKRLWALVKELDKKSDFRHDLESQVKIFYIHYKNTTKSSSFDCSVNNQKLKKIHSLLKETRIDDRSIILPQNEKETD